MLAEENLSDEARTLIAGIRGLQAPGSIYLRGSVLEQAEPFLCADLDLFVIDGPSEPRRLWRALTELTARPLDVKWLTSDALRSHRVFSALLAHRSLHVCGPRLPVEAQRADADFCWRHWVEYGVADFPSHLQCADPHAVLDFKRLVRCYGVILLLREGIFTRDIGACIEYAGRLRRDDQRRLIELRRALEQRRTLCVEVRDLKRQLIALFDRHWQP